MTACTCTVFTTGAHGCWCPGLHEFRSGLPCLTLALAYSNGSGQIEDVTPSHTSGSWNVRTTVHEYGGGSYALSSTHAYFANFKCACSASRTLCLHAHWHDDVQSEKHFCHYCHVPAMMTCTVHGVHVVQ